MRRCYVLLLPLLLTACISNPNKNQQALDDRIQQFEIVVRWGDLNNMYAFLRPQPGQVVEVPEGLGNIRVTSYELAAPLREIRPGQWTQTIAIQYVHKDRQVVKQLVDRQVWEQDPVSEQWHRLPPIPSFQ